MKNTGKFRKLSKKELTNISGGHHGFFYKAGRLWMATTLAVLGTMAGIADGIDAGME